MIPQISKALSSGFTSKQVIDFIMKKFPEHAEKIQSAMTAGFTIDQILRFLSKGSKEKIEPDVPRGTPYSQMRNRQVQEKESRENKALGVGALAATSLAAPMATAALQRAIPSNLLQTVASSLPLGQSPLPSATIPATNTLPMPPINQPQQPPGNLSPQSMPQEPIPAQPQIKTINANQLFNNNQSKEKIDQLIKAGNGPLEVSGYFKKFHPDIVKKIEKESGMPFQKVVDEYVQTTPTQEQKAVEPASQELDETKEIEGEEETQITKGESVIAPEGMGQVKEIRGNKALVEIDGKLKKVSVDDLEKPIFSENEIADKYDQYMESIPEEHKSGFISWSGYDEKRNVLGFIPRGGSYFELENISPTEAHIIKEGVGIARTSGETREGLWILGEDTRGGLISQIIHDRKKKKKSVEEQQLKLFDLPKKEKEEEGGMKPIFDENEYGRNLSRERDRKKKLEEKERKKKEKERLKNEAKKRKK